MSKPVRVRQKTVRLDIPDLIHHADQHEVTALIRVSKVCFPTRKLGPRKILGGHGL
ncbi:MAG: hypothetical protein QOF48_3276 [Verrucomicrobiota bacterium]